MARPLRIQQPGYWYHVIARGNAGLCLFTHRAEYQHFLDLLAKAHAQFSLEVHAYVLMRTHIHLFVRTPLANLSRCMQFLLTSYSVWYNRRHERVGHVFQGRYKAIVVERDAYGSEVSRYIHLNPARASGVQSLERARHTARSYSWSSYRAYLALSPAPPFLSINDTLERFGGNTARGRKAYAQFVEEGLLRDRPDLLNDVRAQSVLGTDTFAEQVKRFVMTVKHDRCGHVNAERLVRVPIEKILAAVAAATGVPPEQLIRPRCRHNPAWLLVLWAACKWCRASMSLAQIGAQLGGISGVAVYKAERRCESLATRSPALRTQMQHVRQYLESADDTAAVKLIV
ncbi:MAG: transposase [bacterium]|nr:transposase [bacterium]